MRRQRNRRKIKYLSTTHIKYLLFEEFGIAAAAGRVVNDTSYWRLFGWRTTHWTRASWTADHDEKVEIRCPHWRFNSFEKEMKLILWGVFCSRILNFGQCAADNVVGICDPSIFNTILYLGMNRKKKKSPLPIFTFIHVLLIKRQFVLLKWIRQFVHKFSIPTRRKNPMCIM